MMMFGCEYCNETFSESVWHCPGCDHHAIEARAECGNCRRARTLVAHPIANVFPMMNEDEHAALLASMRAVGFDSAKPIAVYEGKILDGRNRHKAAKELGLEVTLRPWTEADGNPWEFVRRENTARRNLEAGTTAACVLKLNAGSDAWESKRAESRDKANEARSVAAKAQARSVDGRMVATEAGRLPRGKRPADNTSSAAKRTDAHEHERLAATAGVSSRTAEIGVLDTLQGKRVYEGSSFKHMVNWPLRNLHRLAEYDAVFPNLPPISGAA